MASPYTLFRSSVQPGDLVVCHEIWLLQPRMQLDLVDFWNLQARRLEPLEPKNTHSYGLTPCRRPQRNSFYVWID